MTIPGRGAGIVEESWESGRWVFKDDLECWVGGGEEFVGLKSENETVTPGRGRRWMGIDYPSPASVAVFERKVQYTGQGNYKLASGEEDTGSLAKHF